MPADKMQAREMDRHYRSRRLYRNRPPRHTYLLRFQEPDQVFQKASRWIRLRISPAGCRFCYRQRRQLLLLPRWWCG